MAKKSVRAITPISYAVGKQVTTIEGLPAVWAAEKSLSAADAANTLHPIQQAWIDEQVPQCGYCQSGMMIVAVQLLAKNPNPTVAQNQGCFHQHPPSPHLWPLRHLHRYHRCRATRGHRDARGKAGRLDDSKNKKRPANCQSRSVTDPHTSPHHAARLRKKWARSFRLALDSRRTFPPCRRKPHVA